MYIYLFLTLIVINQSGLTLKYQSRDLIVFLVYIIVHFLSQYCYYTSKENKHVTLEAYQHLRLRVSFLVTLEAYHHLRLRVSFLVTLETYHHLRLRVSFLVTLEAYHHLRLRVSFLVTLEAYHHLRLRVSFLVKLEAYQHLRLRVSFLVKSGKSSLTDFCLTLFRAKTLFWVNLQIYHDFLSQDFIIIHFVLLTRCI